MKMSLAFVVSLFVISFFLRIYNISCIPPILSVNELQTGLAALHGTLQSPTIGPLAIIATIPFVKIFGLSPIAIRLPSVIAAILYMLIFFLITRKKFPSISLIALLFLTFSPFAIQIARVDTGINVGLFFFLLGVYEALFVSKYPKLLLCIAISFVLAIYASYALFFPSVIAFAIVVVFSLKKDFRNFSLGMTGLLLLVILLIPIFFQSFSYATRIDDTNEYLLLQKELIDQGRVVYSQNTRLSKILYYTNIEVIKFHLQHISHYFQPHKLFFTWDYNPDYIASNSGLFYPFDLIFFIAGIIYLLRKDRFLFGALIIIAVLPDALINVVPNASHILLMLPLVVIINAFGFVYLLNNIHKKFRWVFLCGVVLIGGYFILRFFYMYFVVYPKNSAASEMEYVKAFVYGKNHFPKSKKVIITDTTFGKNIYLYSLFFTKDSANPHITKNNNSNVIATYNNHVFLSTVPTVYMKGNIYIQPKTTVPEHAKVFFTSNAKDKEHQISIFTK